MTDTIKITKHPRKAGLRAGRGEGEGDDRVRYLTGEFENEESAGRNLEVFFRNPKLSFPLQSLFSKVSN